MLSIVIPAHDEAEVVESAVRAAASAAKQTQDPFEVIVVDDASTDSTGAIAEAAGARVIKIAARQIAGARNAGAAAARGEMLIFVDADTLVNAAVVRAAVEAMRGGALGGGADVKFDEPIPGYVKRLWRVGMWWGRLMRWSAGWDSLCLRIDF